MKKLIYFCLIPLLFLFSCSSGGDSGTNTTPAQVQNILSTGVWRITFLNNNAGTIKTNNFQGYNFQFNTSGSVTASNGSNSYTGGFDIFQNSNKNYFDLLYQQPQIFQDLSGIWDINSVTSTKIQLHYNEMDNNPSIDPLSENNILTFEKN